MRKSNIFKDIPNQKYLSVEDGKVYWQVGRNTLVKIATRAGAIRRIGRRVLIDKVTLDEYIDSQNK